MKNLQEIIKNEPVSLHLFTSRQDVIDNF